MLWLDQKYIGLVSSHLENFKRRGDKWSFRCPLCGDSKKKRSKSRGGFFIRDQQAYMHCFNCSTTITFSNFLKIKFSDLYREYYKEAYLEKQTGEQKIENIKLPNTPKYDILNNLPQIASLPDCHPAKEYVKSRKIPGKFFYRFYYAENYNAWVNSIIPNKLPNYNTEGRIVIPFISKSLELVGFTGRSLLEDSLRYVTIMIDETAPKIFGLDVVNLNQYIYVLEGAFDSTFFPNAVSMNGSDFKNIFDPLKTTIIYDNEPFNYQIKQRLIETIKLGYGVFIWPSTFLGDSLTKIKDISDLVMSELVDDVKKFVDTHTYRNNIAIMKLAKS